MGDTAGAGPSVGDIAGAAMGHLALGAMAPQNLIALQVVLETLGHSATLAIDFEIPNIAVTPQTFAAVRHAILFGRIRVALMDPSDPDAAMADGVYEPTDNLLKITTTRFRERLRAVIVHECVHAAHDIDKRTSLFRLESEAAGYIAEALFVRRLYPMSLQVPTSLRLDPAAGADAAEVQAAREFNAIHRAAWTLATRIHGGTRVIPAGDADLAALNAALAGTALYKDAGTETVAADGVGG